MEFMRKTNRERAKPDVPEGFIQLVKQGMEQTSLSARQVALQSGISPAYFCRLLLGERGLPPDETIAKMARVLQISPTERLLLETGRVPEDVKGELVKDLRVDLLRATNGLTPDEIEKVMKTVKSLRLKRLKKSGKN